MFGKTMVRSLFAVVLAVLMFAGTAISAVVLPTGLAPGSEYLVIFATADTTTAESRDINYYNSFVTSEAAQSSPLSSVTWKVVAATDSVSAYDNALPGNPALPIYNTEGQLVATSYSALLTLHYSLVNAPQFNQFGVTNIHQVWTGTDFGGSYGNGLGDPTPEVGFCNQTNAGWLAFSSGPSNPYTDSLSLYALSTTPLTFEPVPEPSSLIAWAGLAAMGLIGCVWERRKGKA